MYKTNLRSQKGFALLTSVIVVSVMLLTSFTLATIFIREMRGASVYEDSVVALKAADSGIERALGWIKGGGTGNWNCPPDSSIECTVNNIIGPGPGGEGYWDGMYNWDNVSSSSENSFFPQIQIDSQDNSHIVWNENNLDNYYTKMDSNSWIYPPTNISNTSGTSYSPLIQLSEDKPYVIWQDNTPGNWDVYYSKQNDTGGWVTSNASNTFNDSYSPKFQLESSADPSNPYVHVVWGEYDNSAGNWEIFYTKGTNSGSSVSWAPSINISQTPGASESPQIQIDLEGNIHVIWVDNSSGDYDIYYNKWTASAGWASTPINISNMAGDSWKPQFQLDTSVTPNIIHVVWQDYKPGNPNIYYNKWTASAGWLPNPIEIADTFGSANYPKIRVFSGNPYVVWQDSSTGAGDIYFSRWNPGTNTWAKGDGTTGYDNLSSDSNVSQSPQIQIDSKGNVYVVWENISLDEIFYTKGTNNGTTIDWAITSENISQASGLSSSPQIQIDSSGNPHVVWQDRFFGNYEVFYTRWNGTAWMSYIGDNLSNSPSDETYFPRIQIGSGDNLQVAWVENYTSSDSKITFKKWDGSKWQVLVGPGLIGPNGDTKNISELVFALDDSTNTPYIAWVGSPRGNTDTMISKWDSSINRWTKMDGTVFSKAKPFGYDNLSDNSGSSFTPQVQIDLAGNPHVVWKDETDYEIHYTKWTGSTWDQAVITNSSRNVYNPQFQLQDSGIPNNPYVHVVWEDNTPADTNFDIYYNKWNGSSWAGPTNISNTSSNSERPQIQIDSSGNPHIVWQDDTEGNFDIYYTKWNGSWVNGDGDPGYDNLSQNSAASYEPQIQFSGDKPYIVWWDYSTADGKPDIFFSKWNGTDWVKANGTALGSENISNTSSNSFSPQFQIDLNSPDPNNPYIHVVWWDNTPGNYEIYYTRWTGTEWIIPANISLDSGTSEASQIQLDSDGNPHVVWKDDTPGNWDTYYSKWHPGTGVGPSNEYTITATGTSNNVRRRIEMKIRINGSIEVIYRREIAL